MISWHRVGQEVVCVDPTGSLCLEGVYTIRRVLVMSQCVGFVLNEAKNHPDFTAFKAERFRPVYPHRIEALKALITSPEVTKRSLEEA